MPPSKLPLLEIGDRSALTYVKAHAEATDRWLSEIFATSVAPLTPDGGVALVAVGGYGNGERAPFSDIDVLLVHENLPNYAEVAEAIWYPIWDRGIKVGYAVVTLEQAATLLAEELHWATALLSARHVCGDRALTDALCRSAGDLWRTDGVRLVDSIAESVHARHRNYGDVAFQIEPQLKEGRGGLRDVHALRWAATVDDVIFASSRSEQLETAGALLLEVRVALHRLEGRGVDTLSLDLQDELAAAMNYPSGHELMVDVAQAGRTVAWLSDEAWAAWTRTRRPFPHHDLDPASPYIVNDGTIGLLPAETQEFSAQNLLELAHYAALHGLALDRDTLAAFARSAMVVPSPWDARLRQLFAGLLLTRRAAIDVIDDLDHFDLFTRFVPEWHAVRCCPQRNVMHTWTVDRHLCETAANAAALVDRVERPDLLVVGALLHDIGKGRDGDHTEIGMELIETIGARMGYPDEEVAVLVDLCKHHLLLPDFATRRDLADPGTINAVAAAVDSVEFLEMLAALTEADSIATGPATWGTWKAGLLQELVSRTTRVLEGEALEDMGLAGFPSDEVRTAMERGELWFDTQKATLVAVAPNESALLSRVAGALAISGLDVLDAASFIDDDHMSACRFTVQPPATGVVDWEPVVDWVRRALEGQVALTARVQQRAQRYQRFQRTLAATPPRVDVVIDNHVSDVSTVLEVHAPDSIGLLYRITQALSELCLEIRTAKVQTFGPQAVDSFYVVNHHGHKILERGTLEEIDRALRFVLG